MEIPEPELHHIDMIWNSVKEGHLENIKYYKVTWEDIKKVEEFYRFNRMMKRDRVNGVSVISLDDANTMLSFFKYFQIRHSGIEDACLYVLYKSEDGYEARDDVYRWYIREKFTCEKCGKITKPFYSTCDECASEKRMKNFDPMI